MSETTINVRGPKDMRESGLIVQWLVTTKS